MWLECCGGGRPMFAWNDLAGSVDSVQLRLMDYSGKVRDEMPAFCEQVCWLCLWAADQSFLQQDLSGPPGAVADH